MLVLIHQPLSYVSVIDGESLLSREVKRTLLIEIVSMEMWLLRTPVFFLTDVTFICFSSVFKLDTKEFLVQLRRGLRSWLTE